MAFGAYFEKDIKTEFFLIFETNITIIEKEKSFFVIQILWTDAQNSEVELRCFPFALNFGFNASLREN